MSADALRVAVADDNSAHRQAIKEMLGELGHEVVVEAQNGDQLVTRVAVQKPDLVIADLHMPVMGGLEAAEKMAGNEPTPVVMTTSSHSPRQVTQALERENVVGYLVKPFAAVALDGAMRMAHGLFLRIRGLHERLMIFQRSQADRQIVDQAKLVLMKRMRVTEPEAHRRLQKMASANNEKLIDLARAIIAASDPEP